MEDRIPADDPPSPMILVVDDDPVIPRMLAAFLEDSGFRVCLSSDGLEALRQARRAPPDLILLDVVMPRMDGLEVCKRLKEDESLRDIPVILMSGLSETWEKVRGFQAGAADYVTKPFQRAEVLARVNVQVSLRAAHRQLEARNRELHRQVEQRVHAEDALQRAHDELEQRVQERTAELAQVNRLLRVLSDCNQAVVRATEEGPLTEEVCRILVESGGHLAAFVVLLEPAGRGEWREVASRGWGVRLWDGAIPAGEGRAPLQALVDDTVRSGCVKTLPGIHLESEPATDPAVGSCRGECSCIALPLHGEERPLGALVICARRASPFLPRDLEIMEEMAGDLAFGLRSIRTRAVRVQAERELSTANRRLQDIIEFLPDATFVVDEERRVIAWNRALEVMTGTRKEDILGQGDHAYAVPFYGERRPIAIDLVVEPADVVGDGYTYVRRQGSTVFAEARVPSLLGGRGADIWVTASPLLDSEGRTVGAIESVRDITELKASERALRQAEEKYRGLFENAIEGIFQSTIAGRFISVNPAFAHILGYESPEDLMACVTDIPSQLYADPGVRQQLIRTVETEGSAQGVEILLRRKDGATVWVSESTRAVRDEHGQVEHLEGFLVEITERKRMEDMLRRSEEKYRGVVENAQEAIIIAQNGLLVLVNPAFSRLSGYSAEEAAHKPITDLIHPDDQEVVLRYHMDRLRGAEVPTTFTFRYVTRGGDVRWVENSGARITWEGGPAALSFLTDVTDRVRVEEELRESEDRYRALYEDNPAMYFTLDERGTVLSVNEFGARQLGYEAAELVGRPVLDIFVPEDRDAVGRQVRILLDDPSQVGSWEFRKVRKDGTVLWVRETARVVQHPGEAPVLLIVCEDVTDRKQVEEALRTSEERLGLIFDNTSDLLVLFEVEPPASCRVVAVNRSMIAQARACGLAVELADVLDQRLEDMVRVLGFDQDDAAHRLQRITEVVETGETLHYEESVDLPVGRVFFEVALCPILDAQGRCRHILRSARDITTSKAAAERQARLQAEVSAAASEWTSTFDAVKSALVLTDLEGVVRRLNVAARELAGKPWSELVGEPLRRAGSGEPWQTAGDLVDAVAEARTVGADHVRDETTGRTWAIEAVRFARDSDRVILSMHDITPLLELQESLRRKETMSAMGSLVGGVAHEVRNPLFAISGLLDALDARFGRSEQLGEFLDGLRRETDRLTALMRALLEYGRPVSEERTEAPIDLVIAEAVRLCHRDASARQIEVAVRLPAGLPQPPMDRMRMVEVFRNLVENAIQHSPPGTGVDVEARPGTAERPDWLTVLVRDSGPGFPEATREKVFQPFYSRRVGGTGLGLSIVQRIVTAHGGEVRAGDHPSGGGLVTVELPAGRGPA